MELLIQSIKQLLKKLTLRRDCVSGRYSGWSSTTKLFVKYPLERFFNRRLILVDFYLLTELTSPRRPRHLLIDCLPIWIQYLCCLQIISDCFSWTFFWNCKKKRMKTHRYRAQCSRRIIGQAPRRTPKNMHRLARAPGDGRSARGGREFENCQE